MATEDLLVETTPADDPGSMRRKDPRFEARRLADGLYSLLVRGRLPTGWSGNLSLGLARSGVDIVWGYARRLDGGWEAELRLQPKAPHVNPLELDYLRLLRGRASDSDVPLVVTSYQVHPLPGALALEIRGVDCVGFLGSLLHRLAFLSLFPEEMSIETHAGEATDRFRLRSLAGREPSAETVRALNQMLGDLARQAGRLRA